MSTSSLHANSALNSVDVGVVVADDVCELVAVVDGLVVAVVLVVGVVVLELVGLVVGDVVAL